MLIYRCLVWTHEKSFYKEGHQFPVLENTGYGDALTLVCGERKLEESGFKFQPRLTNKLEFKSSLILRLDHRGKSLAVWRQWTTVCCPLLRQKPCHDSFPSRPVQNSAGGHLKFERLSTGAIHATPAQLNVSMY